MKEYFHAWNVVFDGLPRPFWKVFKNCSNLKYAWENLKESDLKKLNINDLYIRKFTKIRNSKRIFEDFYRIEKDSIKMLDIRDEMYPSCLRSLNNHLPPLILYAKGNINTLKKQSLSVVGTRQMTSYGERVTRQIINNISNFDIAITSGMAQGIDTIAHKSAIECDMCTIAVLGCGLRQIPYYRLKFAQKIIQKGLIISEYPPDLPAQKYHFPLRNRIISGLSKATLVVEAGMKSGARITAQYALDQSRDVYAVPGNIYSEKSKGTNLLIQQSAAHPLLEHNDLLGSYTFTSNKAKNINNYPRHHQKIMNLLKDDQYSANDLFKKISLSASEFNFALTELELEGALKKTKDGKYFVV